MNRLFYIFILTFSLASAYAQDVPQVPANPEQAAEELYRSGQYEQAAELYTQLLAEKGESAEVYYNLGNTFFKQELIGKAILNYERALLFSPSDKDILFNLELARAKTVDQINVSESFLLKKWFSDIENMFSESGWGIAALGFFFLFIVSLFLFFFSRFLLMKKISFYVGCTAFLLVIFCNVFAYAQYKEMKNRDQSIVMAATVTVKSSPDKSGTDLFVLHEGTKVTVKSELSSWVEIELADGAVGWIENSKIERI